MSGSVLDTFIIPFILMAPGKWELLSYRWGNCDPQTSSKLAQEVIDSKRVSYESRGLQFQYPCFSSLPYAFSLI